MLDDLAEGVERVGTCVVITEMSAHTSADTSVYAIM